LQETRGATSDDKMQISHAIIGIVLFTVLMGAIVSFHDGVETSYVLPADQAIFNTSKDLSKDTGLSIGQELNDITVFTGLDMIGNLYTIFASGQYDSLSDFFQSGNLFDIAGTIILAVVGGVLAFFGVFVAPFQIAGIFANHYNWLPYDSDLNGIIVGLLVCMVVYLYFALKKVQTNQGGL